MLSECIRAGNLPTKVCSEVTPRRMDVVVVVLGAVIFNEEGLTLNAVVVALSRFHSTHPRKNNVLPAFFIDGRNLTDKTYAATTSVTVNANGADSAQFSPGEGRSVFAGVEVKW